MESESGLFRHLPEWLRRRHPRLSGTLRIREAPGHITTIPLRGRAAVLTAGGTGLAGEGTVWAVHTDPDATVVSLMISYGRTGRPADRESGLCPPGATITLAGADFTWHRSTGPARPQPATIGVPRPRPGENTPAHPAETTSTHSAESTPAHPTESTPVRPGESTPVRSAESTPVRPGEGTPAVTRAPGNVAPAVSRDPGPIRNSRTPRTRSANARPITPTLRQRVRAIVRDLTGPPHR
ncbi:hypothetical protein SAMN06264365_106136 [Actinoplanes regularis]|uniref:Uncharacterized protein n=1 Tax=Actinoplanes regularis TaxID=52697 RepID=A0A238ZLN5_9ACTN|nr:hypothetical protein Are01nite_40720 [Actinoplanes regularis]SNR84315.1 hypothetical protein SAMN06264365_106136 [Actinoplanes regularis]